MLTFLWWAVAIASPAVVALHAIRRGRKAMQRGDSARAEVLFERAAKHSHYRQAALCHLARTALQSQQPQKALMAIDRLYDQAMPVRDRGAQFLRALACLGLREGHAALEILARYAEAGDASVEERLAMAHACILVEDFDAAGVFLTMIPREHIAGPLRGRLQLCEAAIHYHYGRLEQMIETLPAMEDCSVDDGLIVQKLHRQHAERKMAGDIESDLCQTNNN